MHQKEEAPWVRRQVAGVLDRDQRVSLSIGDGASHPGSGTRPLIAMPGDGVIRHEKFRARELEANTELRVLREAERRIEAADGEVVVAPEGDIAGIKLIAPQHGT